MKLTKFRRLRKAIEALDVNLIGRTIRGLEEQLISRGLILEPQNVAITQEGIFYIEPQSGVATKVVAYLGDFGTTFTKAQKANLSPNGYHDHDSIGQFHPYHIMRCNTLAQAEREGWPETYRVTKRTDGSFYFRIVNEHLPKGGTREIYQEIDRQPLYICSYCLWKVTSILVGAQGTKREQFNLQQFFDVNVIRSWNSRGLLSKDHGFTTDMYPADWLEITRIRKEQVSHCCESCFVDLSDKKMQHYLHVHPTDHIEGQEGYVKLECLCLGCLADLPEYASMKERPELVEYLKELNRRARADSVEGRMRKDTQRIIPTF